MDFISCFGGSPSPVITIITFYWVLTRCQALFFFFFNLILFIARVQHVGPSSLTRD